MRRHFVLFCALLILAACDADRATTPVAPSPPAVLPPAQGNVVGTWRGDATVLARTGTAGCGWGTTIGDTRTGVWWQVTFKSGSVLLDEDMANWPTDHIPYSGSLDGHQFAATYSSAPGYERYVCQFKGAELSGSFSSDFKSFEATETLAWGTPGAETTVQRRWTVTFIPGP